MVAAVAVERSVIRPVESPNRKATPAVPPVDAPVNEIWLVVASLVMVLFVTVPGRHKPISWLFEMTGAEVPNGRLIAVPFCGHGKALVK